MALQAPSAVIADFVARESLPPVYAEQALQYFWPLAQHIFDKHRDETTSGTLCVGVHGSQGSGKSTLTELLAVLLQACGGLRTATLSLDDIYLTRAERSELAQRVHPLLATRGVPGTHDVALGCEVIRQLRQKLTSPVALPRFDKSVDDRAPVSAWPQIEAPVAVIFFEGWCLATPSQEEVALMEPVNALEAKEDTAGIWRRYVNEQLGGAYRDLFAEVDWLLMLQAPGFECVYQWREQQENALVARTGKASPLLQPGQLARFISHYERLTHHSLQTLPARADCVVHLQANHSVAAVNYR